MKLKLFTLSLFIFSSYTFAQVTKSEVYQIGTKLSFYPGECGNAIPEAVGKLTFCDKIGNLGVVDESTGLNQRSINQMLDNRANQDEVFITSSGLSIRKTDGIYENVPNIAINDEWVFNEWRNEETFYGGLVMPNNNVIFAGQRNALYVYDRANKTITANEIADVRYPRAFAYDDDRNLAWIIFTQSNFKFLYSYSEANGLNLVADISLLNAAQVASTYSATLTYKDDHLYLGATNGLYKINVNTFAISEYNTTTTPGLPHDRVNDLKLDDDGNVWMANTETNDGSIVKFNIANETYEQYQLPRLDNQSLNYYFQKLALDDSGTIWSTASNFSGLIKLEFDAQNDPVWTPTTFDDLNDFGVGTLYVPNNVYYRNSKFYFTSNNFSSSSSNADEILINDNGNWSSISDNKRGNTSYLSNNRYNFNLPDNQGGMWWFNYFDDVISHRSADGELVIFDDFENLGNTAAIDIDGKPIARLGTPNFKIRKLDLPATYELLDEPNQNTTGLVRYKDEVWWYNNSTYEIKVIKYNQVIATFSLDNSYQNTFYFDVDSNGDAWFAKNQDGELIVKKYDTGSQTTTDFANPSLGQVRAIEAGPNGTMWIATQLGIVYYDGTNFTNYLANDYAELYNIRTLVVDTNGNAYVLLNDNAAITKIENAGAENVSFSITNIENTNSILPALDHYRPADLSIDKDGAIWTNASLNTFKLIDDDTAKEYRVEGETYVLSGLIYNDINEDNLYTAGEEFSGQPVALKLNGVVYNTYTDVDGIYRFYLYEENADYEITLPTIGQYVTAANRQLVVNVGNADQNYDGNDFQLKPKFINSLLIKSSSKQGAWGFVRENFENTFTTAIGNLSPTKTFNDLSVTYGFQSVDLNNPITIPDIDDVTVYELDPNGSIQLIEKVTIDQRNNKWRVNADPNSYMLTDLNITPTITTEAFQTFINVVIPAVSPLNTYIIEIKTELFDAVQTGQPVQHGVYEIDSSDFEDSNGATLSGPVVLIPLEDRDEDVCGFPFEFPETPYLDPEDVYSDPPYLDPSQVYGPGPYRTSIFSSYDPNDKLVDEGVPDVINDRHIGRKWLTYTIRFENTGNFSAKDVVITDALDSNLDANSVMVIEASHNYAVDLLKDANNQSILKFSFNDIFLPFDDENNDGYIKFMVKAVEDIAEDTVVDNQANIYFDQNPPINTNVIQVRFLTIESLGVDDEQLATKLQIYPNPVNEIINIKSQVGIETVAVYSMLGDKVLETSNYKIDVSNLANGTYIIKIQTEVGVISKKLIVR